MEPETSAPQSGAVPRIRVLIVEDHLVTRMGLRALLERFPQLEIVGDAASVAGAVDEASKRTPDLVLLDVRLPDGTGFEACRQMRELGLKARVLMLTSYADEEWAVASLEAGADGYLLKEIDGEGLLHAIQSVASGNAILDPAITRAVLDRFRAGSVPSGGLPNLSAQERRVLSFIAQGKTNKQIAEKMSLSEKTVKNYVSKTLDKLKVSRRSEAAAVYVRNQD